MNSKFTMIVRILLGVMLVIFGSNKFLHFIPMDPATGAAGEFMNSLGATGYIFPIVGILEVFIGIMLLLKKWVPFVVILLAPISINILLFHLFCSCKLYIIDDDRGICYYIKCNMIWEKLQVMQLL